MPTREGSDARWMILDAIVEAKVAWVTLDRLAASLEISLDDLNDGLADLEGVALVVGWDECPGGLAITLTPIGASLLGVRIFEDGPKQTPRWFPIGFPEPLPPRSRRVFRDGEMLSLVIDPRQSPLDLMVMREEEEEGRKRRRRRKAKGAWQEGREDMEKMARKEAKEAERARKIRKSKRRARVNARPETREKA